MTQTPRELGFSMPAEWAPHRGTWLSWPHKEESWPGKFEPVPDVFAEMVRVLAAAEEVHINAGPEVEAAAREVLRRVGVGATNVFFHANPTNDAWCRDHGPCFVQRTVAGRVEEAIIDWGYNAWGGKYPPFDLDDVIPTRIGAEYGIPVFHPGIVMEGGAIDVNGAGTLMTSESCLLNKNRNPQLSKAEIEGYLRDYYGVRHILWLGDGIAGDDTDGHIDDLARFIGPRTIVIAVEDDPKDANYRVLRSARRQIELLRDQDGRAFEIIEIPMPRPVTHDGERLPATYVNFYFVNGALLVPTYR
ncbi:MAG TPA: agmatine deiminase family protein, partial [Gemmatimonadales bacterium]|nr:agmatine deiminase family protein [Gemmatimonadales bacterium]